MSLPRRLHQLGHMILEGGQEEDERHQDLLPTGFDADDDDDNGPDPGYLHLGAQSKATYISPSHFASIRQEVDFRDQQPTSAAEGLYGSGRNARKNEFGKLHFTIWRDYQFKKSSNWIFVFSWTRWKHLCPYLLAALDWRKFTYS
ncbi:hypothetical protein D0869_04917 [Hortaea werneckii]|uniref:Uncharacterized protein n=1 Tax=Hortaea werneckii TaxID=91943 RepID=A0A3M7AAD3_HORWE|nr:hypothetical protein D0869_04917 [Hortaea werneckii]RMY10853.1 hypothetical protein D0868_03468 [Hortaea werneckii]RMY24339.1 hypothetical protein D0867_01450 [Hortaea werneckii]RMY31806.1 hypothetical protein D0866_07042 [Hortaea werneckii]